MSDKHESMLARVRREAAERRAAGPAKEVIPRTWGEHAADWVAGALGSWRFVIIQSALLIFWLVWNANTAHPLDPFPFILLNLLLSFQAAYTAPMILMSQNRQADIDRERAIADFAVNCKAELEIETMHEKLDLLREREIADLVRTVARLSEILEAQPKPGTAPA